MQVSPQPCKAMLSSPPFKAACDAWVLGSLWRGSGSAGMVGLRGAAHDVVGTVALGLGQQAVLGVQLPELVGHEREVWAATVTHEREVRVGRPGHRSRRPRRPTAPK